MLDFLLACSGQKVPLTASSGDSLGPLLTEYKSASPPIAAESTHSGDIVRDHILKVLALEEILQVVSLLVRSDSSSNLVAALQEIFDDVAFVSPSPESSLSQDAYTAINPLAPVTSTRSPLLIVGMMFCFVLG